MCGISALLTRPESSQSRSGSTYARDDGEQRRRLPRAQGGEAEGVRRGPGQRRHRLRGHGDEAPDAHQKGPEIREEVALPASTQRARGAVERTDQAPQPTPLRHY